MINGKQVCIRDGTWYECEVRDLCESCQRTSCLYQTQGGHTDADFIRQVNEEYERLNSHD